MPSRPRFTLGLGFALALAILAWPREARAEPRPLVVAVDASSDVAADDVRRAVAAELGATVAGPAESAPEPSGRLDVSSRGGVLRVTFHDGHGRTITREVTAPQGGADRVRLIALLAGNLARNEAEELARPVKARGDDEPDPKGMTVRAAPGEVVRVEIDARGAPAAPSSVAPPAPSPTPEPAEEAEAPPAAAPRLAWRESPPRHRGSGQRTAGWITLGSGLTVGGAGLLLGMTAQQATSELRATCAPSCTAQQMDSVRARLVVADVTIGIGAIAAVTGIVLVLTAPSAKAPIAVEVGGRSIGIVGAF